MVSTSSYSLCRIDAGNRIVVGDICMYLQLALRGAVSEEIYHRWMAPEGIRENRFTEKSDVVGILHTLMRCSKL